MSTTDVAMLRIAGFPIRLWTTAAAPELFALARKINTDTDKLRARSTTLVQRIGSELVRHPDLSARQRAAALGVRRALHGGGKVDKAELAAIADTAEWVLPATDLAAELRDVAEWLGKLAVDETELIRAVEAAQLRLLDMPWALVCGSPVAWRALREAHPAMMSDIADRVAAGEGWTTKRMRQRADFLWRMIARGATRATPRGWFAHIALLAIDSDLPHGPLPSISACYAIERSDNLHLRTINVDPTEPDALLMMAPLHWDCDGTTQFWVVHADDPARLRRFQVRTTAALERVRRALQNGALTAAQLETLLLPHNADDCRRVILRKFILHLVQLGVVSVSRPAERVLDGWHETITAVSPVGSGCYVDVHRRPMRGLSRATCTELERLVGVALQVLAVIESNVPVSATFEDRLSEQPRPLLSVVAETLASRPTSQLQPTAHAHQHDWPLPVDQTSPYARLHSWLTTRLDRGSVDLDAEALAAAGVSHVEAAPVAWPLDCLFRPLWTIEAGPRAVLDRLVPTGTFDSRFADGLAGLHDRGNARVGWYREFLRLLEEQTGGRFVELLAPPLSERAANAIRRPLYTRFWTGDPDARCYYGTSLCASARYLPLGDITVRQDDGGRVVEAAGELIWPVYHATRAMPPPWDLVGALILDTGPRPSPQQWRSLRYSLPVWPGRDFVPRITVGGGALVLSCAQWRLSLGACWQASDSWPTKVRTLDRLRRRLELPRWVTLAVDTHDEPRACDLESLQAIHTLDRLRRQGVMELLVTEMLPSPLHAPVADQGAGSLGGSHAELLLRMPLEIDPATMAAHAAAAYRSRSTNLTRKGGD